jgi:hypothetical protein
MMTNGWHYAEGEKTVGPLDLKEMQIALSENSNPSNLWVWKVGFKDWKRAEDVPELAEVISTPPPPPQMTRSRRKPWASQEVWRSVAAIGVCIAVQGTFGGLGAAIAALPLAVGLDWATRRRRQFAESCSKGARDDRKRPAKGKRGTPVAAG